MSRRKGFVICGLVVLLAAGSFIAGERVFGLVSELNDSVARGRIETLNDPLFGLFLAREKSAFMKAFAAGRNEDWSTAVGEYNKTIMSRRSQELTAYSYYNLGNTFILFFSRDKQESYLRQSLEHYAQALRYKPDFPEAKENFEKVLRHLVFLRSQEDSVKKQDDSADKSDKDKGPYPGHEFPDDRNI